MPKIKTPKITDVEVAIVGNYYYVPCVQLPIVFSVWGFKPGSFVPVIGDSHADAEIGFDVLHFHYDWRFVKDADDIPIGSVVALRSHTAKASDFPSLDTPIVWKKRKCYRVLIAFPRVLCKTLESLYKHHKLNCNICPHRGVNLAGIPSDEDGNVVCPAHGFKITAKRGLVMSTERKIQSQGAAMADYCQTTLGQNYSIKPSRSRHNQYEIFIDGYVLRVGGFAYLDGVWIRLDTPLRSNSAPDHAPYFPVPPKRFRDRASSVVSAAIRQFRDVRVSA